MVVSSAHNYEGIIEACGSQQQRNCQINWWIKLIHGLNKYQCVSYLLAGTCIEGHRGQRSNSELRESERRKPNREQVKTTNLVDQELELDDSSAALMLTVALHARTAKANSQIGQRKLDRCMKTQCGYTAVLCLCLDCFIKRNWCFQFAFIDRPWRGHETTTSFSEK